MLKCPVCYLTYFTCFPYKEQTNWFSRALNFNQIKQELFFLTFYDALEVIAGFALSYKLNACDGLPAF